MDFHTTWHGMADKSQFSSIDIIPQSYWTVEWALINHLFRLSLHDKQFLIKMGQSKRLKSVDIFDDNLHSIQYSDFFHCRRLDWHSLFASVMNCNYSQVSERGLMNMLLNIEWGSEDYRYLCLTIPFNQNNSSTKMSVTFLKYLFCSVVNSIWDESHVCSHVNKVHRLSFEKGNPDLIELSNEILHP